MRSPFAVLRHVERRQSNPTISERSASMITEVRTEYQVMVIRVVVLWLTVWTHEAEYI